MVTAWSLGVGECDTSLQAAETAGARGRSLLVLVWGGVLETVVILGFLIVGGGWRW